MTKVLIIATSRLTHGGISSVIKAHETGYQWKKYNCSWVETHRDKGLIVKLAYFIKSIIEYTIIVPFYDIVHIHLSEPQSAFRKLYFVWLAKILHKKIIIHFHAFSPETTIRGKWHNLYSYIFKKADKIIVLSKYWKNIVEDTCPVSNKLIILYNPCITEVLKKEYDIKKQILFAAVLCERKGYEDMIKAFSKIAPKYKDWKIVFAGSGEIEKAKNIAKSLNVYNQVSFLGWVSGATKDKIFKESSIVCLPSYGEGFPMTVLDAWAYGKPVIATTVGGLPDIGEDGENVMMFTPGDIDALTSKMEELINNRKLREHLSEQSLKLSQTTFNIEVISQQLDNIYKQLLYEK